MKKEAATAVFLGIFLGVTVALVMVIKSRQQETSKFKPLTNVSNVSPTVIPVSQNYQSFEITEPQDNFIVNKETVRIKGKTNKDDLIVIQSPIKEMVLKNKTNDFSIDFPLTYGENVIRISIYPKDQSLRSQEKRLTVYYLDE